MDCHKKKNVPLWRQATKNVELDGFWFAYGDPAISWGWNIQKGEFFLGHFKLIGGWPTPLKNMNG